MKAIKRFFVIIFEFFAKLFRIKRQNAKVKAFEKAVTNPELKSIFKQNRKVRQKTPKQRRLRARAMRARKARREMYRIRKAA